MPDYTLHLISGPLRFGASEDDAKRLAAELQSHNDEVVSLRAQVDALRENGDRLLAVADSAVEHQREMIEAVAGPLRAEVESLRADAQRYRLLLSLAVQSADALGPTFQITIRRSDLLGVEKSIDAARAEQGGK